MRQTVPKRSRKSSLLAWTSMARNEALVEMTTYKVHSRAVDNELRPKVEDVEL